MIANRPDLSPQRLRCDRRQEDTEFFLKKILCDLGMNGTSSVSPVVILLALVRDGRRWYRRKARVEASAAAGLVGALRPQQHPFGAGDEPLGAARWVSADHANGVRFRDVLGDGEELGHRFERLAEIVLIQSRHDHTLSLIGERIAGRWKSRVEELPFIDADHLGIRIHRRDQFR